MKDAHTQSEAPHTSSDAKTIAIIAYLTIIGLAIAFVMNKDKQEDFATYHIKQSLGLVLLSLGLFVVGMIPILGWIVSFLGTLFLLYLWIMGLIHAINNEKKPVPILGKQFEDWFRNL
jgi:uncharacterized membrane protein